MTMVTGDKVPSGIGEVRTKMLVSALADLGLREEPGRANRGRLNANKRGVDRFQPRFVPDPAPTYAWCAAAVCTWWHDGLERHPFHEIERSVDKLKDRAKHVGHYRSTHPIPGDAFILLHGHDTIGFERGHAGLVLRVIELAPGTGRVRCIEGNLRNAVRLVDRDYDLSLQTSETILGFVSPLAFDQDPAGYEQGFEGHAETPDGTTR
jgi:hypothetical protein